jgi:PAS domain S-box-containing protein
MNSISQKSILLVEDEAITAMAEKQQLILCGYYVTHVLTGEEAVSLIINKNNTFDLILMDIDLGGGIDGTEVARQILEKDDIPVVFLSSHTEREVVEKTEKITSYGYVVKNSGITVLDASIKMAFKLFDAKKEAQQKSDELQIAKNRYQLAVEGTHDALWDWNITTGETFYSYRFYEILGYTHEELPASYSNWENILHPEDYDSVIEYLNKYLSHQIDTYNSTYRMKTKAGVYKWIVSRGQAVWDENDKPVRMTGFNSDITESKLMEEKLRKSEERFRALFENMKSGVAILMPVDNGEDFIFIDINPSAEELDNISKADIKGRRLTDFFTPEDKYGMFQLLRKVYSDGILRDHPVNYIDRQGKRRWRNYTVYQLPTDEIVIILSDYTNRKEKEVELKKLSTVIKQSPAIIVITDTDGNIEYVNPKFESTTGYRLDEVTGSKPNLLKSGDLADKVYAQLWNSIQNGATWRGEFHNRKKDGTYYWELASIAPIFDHDGKTTGFVKLAEDITERKATEEALRESEDKYKALYLKAPIPFQSLNEEGVFVEVNPEWLTVMGYTRDEIIGETFIRFLHPDDHTVFKTNFKMLIEKEKVRGAEYRLRHKHGHYLYFLLEGCLIRKKDGAFDRTFCVLQNITALKHAEKIINENRLNYEAVFEIAIEGVVAVDVVTLQISYSNRQMSEITYYSLNELTLLTIESILPETTFKVMNEYIHGDSFSYTHYFDIPCIRKDGSIVFCNISTAKTVIHGVDSIILLFTDISGKKKTEEELLLTKDLMESTLKAAKIAWWEMRLPSGQVTFSPYKTEMLGYRKEDFTKYQDFTDLVHPDDHSTIMQEMKKHIEGKADTYDVEYRIRARDGSYRWFRDIGMFHKNDKVTGEAIYRGIVEDISKRKEIEQKLMEGEKRYITFFTGASVGIFLADTNANILDTNKQASEILEYTKEELIGMNAMELIHHDDVKEKAIVSNVDLVAKTGRCPCKSAV